MQIIFSGWNRVVYTRFAKDVYKHSTIAIWFLVVGNLMLENLKRFGDISKTDV